jgi:hypothetical protein
VESQDLSLHFSRSTRSINLDSYRAAHIGLILAVGVMLLLLAWFFLSRITLYETSNQVQFGQDGKIQASFSPEAFLRIQPGQAAILRLSLGADQPPVSVPVMIMRVNQKDKLAEFAQLDNRINLQELPPDLKGQVEVEVEHISPLALVMRASGKYLNSSQLPVSPQSIENTSNQ